MAKKTLTKDEPRINLALKPELFDYVQTMAGIRAQSYTAFINDVLLASMEKNSEVYKAAKVLQVKAKQSELE